MVESFMLAATLSSAASVPRELKIRRFLRRRRRPCPFPGQRGQRIRRGNYSAIRFWHFRRVARRAVRFEWNRIHDYLVPMGRGTSPSRVFIAAPAGFLKD